MHFSPDNQNIDFQKGEILLIDKPFEWTSFDVVNKIRILLTRKLGVKRIKVGHAGTLDPLATGLLILCTGKFTKKINELMGHEKVYEGTLKLGETTPSFDRETGVNQKFDTKHISHELVDNTFTKFTGEITQVPPIFSAININGVRAYEYARKDKELKLAPRAVCVHSLKVSDFNLPFVEFQVKCSKGTYIRSLARDIGETLNSGAYLWQLKRTEIGPYKIKDAISIAEFEKFLEYY